MSDFGPAWIPILWTVAGVGWWLIAILLVVRSNRGYANNSNGSGRGRVDDRRITIFKPLASPLGKEEFAIVRSCLESFVADMDANCELLIGGHPAERDKLEDLVVEMKRKYPDSEVRLIIEHQTDTAMNPKVVWNKPLSRHTTGDLWLWSDADIKIEPGAIASLRADLCGHPGVVTASYIVENPGKPADMLDVLFVNLEFYPGAELLGMLNALQGGFGSAMLFEAEAFQNKIDWHELGSHLAEDYVMGKALAPVKLGSVRVATVPASINWKGALLHYLRWHKTIRWCQPVSFASQIVILPVIGWFAWILMDPASSAAWLGLALVGVADTLAAVTINRLLGCMLGIRQVLTIPLWSLLRGFTWIACWFPWPIVWRRRFWWSPRFYDPITKQEPQQEAAMK